MKPIQKILASWQREMGIKPNDDLKLRCFGFPGQRTRRKIMDKEHTPERTQTHSCDYGKKETHVDVIRRSDAIGIVTKHYRAHDNDLLELIVYELERLQSTEPDSDLYEQGIIEGRVQMRTELLTKLKEIVGEEVWTNI